MTALLNIARRLIFWTLPAIALYVVLRRVDLHGLRFLLGTADHFLILSGMTIVALVVAAGALRWHLLAHRAGVSRLSLMESTVEYWASLAVGAVVPGSLGSDAYRIIVMGRQPGALLRSALVIGAEKLAALLTCASLAAAIYFFIPLPAAPLPLVYLTNAVFVTVALTVGVAGAAAIGHRRRLGRRLMGALFDWAARQVRRLTLSRTGVTPEATASEVRTVEGVATLFSVASAVPALALSLVIQVLSAIQAQAYFAALGYEIPFLVNLFVGPLVFFLLVMPISFAGLGVREAAYILLYGAFGVPTDIALLVSLCSSLAVLLSYSVGALLFWVRHRAWLTR